MADTKISQLTAATTPLAGTEILPIVQSGVTKKVSVEDLTAGRAISATQLTLTTGNLIVASGQGIDFSATPGPSAGTMTSELLDDYEEGTWTPTLSSDATPPTVSQYVDRVGNYTKIGDFVFVRAVIRADIANAGTGTPQITGFPFSSKGLEPPVFGLANMLTSLPSSAYMLSGPKLTMNGPSYTVANGVYLVFIVCYQTS